MEDLKITCILKNAPYDHEKSSASSGSGVSLISMHSGEE